MPELHHSYRVNDKSGRCWGTVSLKWEARGTLSGYLLPEPDFAAVKELFARHGARMSAARESDDRTAAEIASLGVTLTDESTGEVHGVGPVFVAVGNLLFTCPQPASDA